MLSGALNQAGAIALRPTKMALQVHPTTEDSAIQSLLAAAAGGAVAVLIVGRCCCTCSRSSRCSRRSRRRPQATGRSAALAPAGSTALQLARRANRGRTAAQVKPLPCASTAFVRPRHRLCLVLPLPSFGQGTAFALRSVENFHPLPLLAGFAFQSVAVSQA